MSHKRLSPKQHALGESTSVQELAKLANQSIELARLVARNTAAPDALLKQLGSHSDATVRKWVATNPNTPPQVLLKLAQQFPEQLLDNPILDLLFLENPNLFADMPIGTIRSLMKRPTTPAPFIRYAMKLKDEGVQLAIAQNRSTPVDIIEQLKEEGVTTVVCAAAKAWDLAELTSNQAEEAFWLEVCSRIGNFGPAKKERKVFMELLDGGIAATERVAWIEDWRASIDVNSAEIELIDLARSGNSIVQAMLVLRDLPEVAAVCLAANAMLPHQRTLARNKSLSPKALIILADSEDSRVLESVASNPKTPSNVLDRLTDGREWKVRYAVARNCAASVESLGRLAKDKYEIVCLGVSRNKAAPIELRQKLLAQLARSRYREIRYELAKYRQTPEKALANLAMDEDFWVRRCVAQNPSTPVDVLKRLAEKDQDDRVRACVAGNRNAPLELLEYLWETNPLWARVYLAQNCSTPEDIWKKLAQDEDVEVRTVLGWSPNTPIELLDLLAQDRSSRVRENVAQNRRTPAKTLARLSQSKIYYIRYEVALNPKTSTQTIERLARDENRLVRETALERLQSIGALG